MPPLIEQYGFGRIVVDGVLYKRDVIIDSGGVRVWWRKSGHLVVPGDLAGIVNGQPSLVVFGTGKFGLMRLSPEVREYLNERGVEFVALPSKKAWRLYNDNRLERVTTGCFHLTC